MKSSADPRHSDVFANSTGQHEGISPEKKNCEPSRGPQSRAYLGDISNVSRRHLGEFSARTHASRPAAIVVQKLDVMIAMISSPRSPEIHPEITRRRKSGVMRRNPRGDRRRLYLGHISRRVQCLTP